MVPIMGESDSLGNPTAPKWFQLWGNPTAWGIRQLQNGSNYGGIRQLGESDSSKMVPIMGESDSLGNPTAPKWFQLWGNFDSLGNPTASNGSDSLSHPNRAICTLPTAYFSKNVFPNSNIKQYGTDRNIMYIIPICMKSKSYCAARVLQSSSRGHPIIQNSYSKYQHGDPNHHH